jgi:hypothetical protein
MRVTIDTADNGLIVRSKQDSLSNQIDVYEVPEIYDAGDRQKLALEAVQSAIYRVMEHLGVLGSKHDNFRLRVIVEDQRDPNDLEGA